MAKDARGHLHDALGRFTGSGSGRRVVKVNGGPARKAGPEHSKKALYGHSLASATTATYSLHRKATVTKWEPGIWSGQDALIKSKYGRGGFEVVGHAPRPAGSTLAARQQRKSARQKMRRF